MEHLGLNESVCLTCATYAGNQLAALVGQDVNSEGMFREPKKQGPHSNMSQLHVSQLACSDSCEHSMRLAAVVLPRPS